MDEPEEELPPDRRSLLTVALAMLAFTIFAWSWQGGWRPW